MKRWATQVERIECYEELTVALVEMVEEGKCDEHRSDEEMITSQLHSSGSAGEICEIGQNSNIRELQVS